MYNTQLETFIKVADAGSFSKAGEDLFISSTAVIKQINLLEERLGFKLFIRSRRGLKLTKSGKSLYKDAKYIVKYSKEAIERARKEDEKEEVIRIGTSPMTPEGAIIRIWNKIKKNLPNMKIQLVPFENTPENAREIMKNLGENIDIVAGIYDTKLLESRNCEALELFKAPISCMVSLNHRLAEKDEITIEDLYNETLMMISRGWNREIDRLRDEIERKYSEIKIEDFNFYKLEVYNKCENSNKILITGNIGSEIHPLLKTLKVKWNYEIPYGIIHSPDYSETVGKFLDEVIKML